MPDTWRIWFKAHEGSRVVIGSKLHVLPSTITAWVTHKRRMPPWQLNRIKACVELGLVPGNGNGGGAHVSY